MAQRIANIVWITVTLAFALTTPTLTQTGATNPDQTVVKEAKWEEFWKTDVRLRSKMPMESIIIIGRRQLFIDNYVIEHSDNLNKVLHQPTKYKGNPVLRPEWPWEMGVENVNNNIGYTNVIYDQDENIYKAWYNIQQYGVAYATSHDGLTWVKPALGLIDFQGSVRNNLVISPRGIDSPTIIKDPFEPDSRKRYKYFAKHNNPEYGIYVGYSADGIRWTIKDEPVLTTRNDPALNDRPTMMQDLEGRRYIAFTKREIINPFGKGDYGFLHRSRAVSLSKDFEKWTDPVLTLRPDDADPHDLQIYGLVGFNYEGFYLGLMDMFWSGDKGPSERTIDIQLALSRDGEVWWRAGDRKTFLSVGQEGTWDRFRVHPANTPPIRKGEELTFFFNGAGVGRHGSRGTLPGPVPDYRRREPWLAPGHPEDKPLKDSFGGTGMGIARLRRDGFVSMDAGDKPGTLITKPLLFSGKDLHVNAIARKGGSICAELFLAERRTARYPAWTWAIDKPISGFALAECNSLNGDSADAVISWKGSQDLEALAGKPVVIRFRLVNASLYSFWVE